MNQLDDVITKTFTIDKTQHGLNTSIGSSWKLSFSVLCLNGGC